MPYNCLNMDFKMLEGSTTWNFTYFLLNLVQVFKNKWKGGGGEEEGDRGKARGKGKGESVRERGEFGEGDRDRDSGKREGYARERM